MAGDLVANQQQIFDSGESLPILTPKTAYSARAGEELVREPFQRLIEEKALLAYKYGGFWQCMDTFKDKERLEELHQGAAPWKLWKRADSPATVHSANAVNGKPNKA